MVATQRGISEALYSMRRLNQALEIYAGDCDFKLPLSNDWADALMAHDSQLGKSTFQSCGQSDSPYCFAMYPQKAGVSLFSYPPDNSLILSEYASTVMNEQLLSTHRLPRNRHGGLLVVLMSKEEILGRVRLMKICELEKLLR